MSRVDDLIANYQRFAQLPWPTGLAPAQRVWMAVYAPEDERRLRLHLPEFETASNAAGHEWALIDITTPSRSGWRRTSTATPTSTTPKLIQPELAGFFDAARRQVAGQLGKAQHTERDRRPGRRWQPVRARRPGEGVGTRRPDRRL